MIQLKQLSSYQPGDAVRVVLKTSGCPSDGLPRQDRDNLAALRERYRALLIRDGKATPVEFKELTGLTRKFIIPLMEYFDVTKLTIRSGDQRLLREKEGK